MGTNGTVSSYKWYLLSNRIFTITTKSDTRPKGVQEYFLEGNRMGILRWRVETFLASVPRRQLGSIGGIFPDTAKSPTSLGTNSNSIQIKPHTTLDTNLTIVYQLASINKLAISIVVKFLVSIYCAICPRNLFKAEDW